MDKNIHYSLLVKYYGRTVPEEVMHYKGCCVVHLCSTHSVHKYTALIVERVDNAIH